MGHRYRINPAELLEWATAEGLPLSPDVFAHADPRDAEHADLADALRAGGIHYDHTARDKDAALRAAIGCLPDALSAQRPLLLSMVLARESTASTGMGQGVAIPHVRSPVLLDVPDPLVTLCFLREPVEYGALDGQPVDTLFLLVCPTVPSHLRLLARLAFALHDATFQHVLRSRAPASEILAAVEALDRALADRTAAQSNEHAR